LELLLSNQEVSLTVMFPIQLLPGHNTAATEHYIGG